MTATGNRDNKRDSYMSGPMSERALYITVKADGRAESTTVLGSKFVTLPAPPGPVGIAVNVC
jgi:hypothetical protein